MRATLLSGLTALVGVWSTTCLALMGRRAATRASSVTGLAVEVRPRAQAWTTVAAAAQRLSSRRGATVRALWPVLVAGVAVTALSRSAVPMVIAGALVGLAETSGSVARRRARDRFDAAIPRLAEGIARSLRSGTSLTQALWDGAESVGDPIESSAAFVRRKVDAGESLHVALRHWAAEHSFDDLHTLVVVCSLGARVGGQLARSFEGCAASMRTRREVAAEVRALSSQARASMIMLAALPVGVAAFMSLLDERIARFLLGSSGGALCLAVAAALDTMAFVWMRVMVRSAW